MFKKNFISIIIPYHKKRIFFKETIDSINKQSYKNFEVIIIYDDTNLNDFEFLQNIAKIDKIIKIIKNDIQLGAGFSRNIGI